MFIKKNYIHYNKKKTQIIYELNFVCKQVLYTDCNFWHHGARIWHHKIKFAVNGIWSHVPSVIKNNLTITPSKFFIIIMIFIILIIINNILIVLTIY